MYETQGRETEAEDIVAGFPALFRDDLLIFQGEGNLFAEYFVSLHPQNIKTIKRMGSIFIIQGILIYIYAFDHRSTFGRLLP